MAGSQQDIPPVSLMIVVCLCVCCRSCVQEDGVLILEGLLNIYWGLRRPIRLQMHDDNERFRFKRYDETQRSRTVTDFDLLMVIISFYVCYLCIGSSSFDQMIGLWFMYADPAECLKLISISLTTSRVVLFPASGSLKLYSIKINLSLVGKFLVEKENVFQINFQINHCKKKMVFDLI